jgi:hypothetical protein
LVFSLFAINEVRAQNQFATDIEERLKAREIPVKQVTTIKRVPYEIEISLQSTSKDDHLSLDDNWYMQLARREATLAYRIGARISSYHLNVYNTDGKKIYSTQIYLYPEDLSQQKLSQESSVDIETAKSLVKDSLKLGNMTLDILDLVDEKAEGFTGRVLLLQVSTSTLEQANLDLPIFLDSFFQLQEGFNSKNGTNIVLCHFRLVDMDGKVLLDYSKDLESGSTQWTAVEGLYSEWFSHPIDASEQPLPVVTIEPYPAPIDKPSVTPTLSEKPNPYP